MLQCTVGGVKNTFTGTYPGSRINNKYSKTGSCCFLCFLLPPKFDNRSESQASNRKPRPKSEHLSNFSGSTVASNRQKASTTTTTISLNSHFSRQNLWRKKVSSYNLIFFFSKTVYWILLLFGRNFVITETDLPLPKNILVNAISLKAVGVKQRKRYLRKKGEISSSRNIPKDRLVAKDKTGTPLFKVRI
jgi:hypothetical protein